MNCTVHVRQDGCEIWVGNQVMARAQAAAAKALSLPLDKVVVHNHLIGGGFGRRLDVDGVVRAVQIAQQVDGPVKVVWTREEDIQHDMYRPYWFDRMSAGLDDKGMPVAWSHRFAGSSVASRWAPPWFKDGLDPDSTEGAIDLVYAFRTCTSSMCGSSLQAFRPPSGAASGPRTPCSWSKASWTSSRPPQSKIRWRIGWLCLIKHRAPKRSLRSPRKRPAGDSHSLKESAVACRSSTSSRPTWRWLPKLKCRRTDAVRVRRVVCAVDCGTVVNPDTVQAQIQSAIIFGITAALHGQITLKDGRVEQSNFDSYQMLRINEAPAIEVHIVQSSEPPGGMGECGTSAIVPAVANAIFAATGKRLRKMPVDATTLKQPA